MLRGKQALLTGSMFLAFGISVWVLAQELEDFQLGDVVVAIHGLPAPAISLAIALTIASYSTLILLEAVGFRIVGSRLSFSRIAFSSFVGYSFANTIGMPLFTGVPIRVRLYSAAGVLARDIARIIAFTSAGFWLGLVGLAGLVLVAEPEVVPIPAAISAMPVRAFGGLLVSAAIGYILFCGLRRKPLRLGRWKLTLPRARLAAGQMLLACVDWGLAAGVLYELLPSHDGLTYKAFLAVFLIAQTLGLLSQVPGGLGVVDSFLVVQLSPELTVPSILSALLLFRMIYLLVPFGIAASALGFSELRRVRAINRR